MAAARGLTAEAAEACAQGRVWTGQQAQARGLVDELGGIEEALDAAKRALGLPADQPVLVERVPPAPVWDLPMASACRAARAQRTARRAPSLSFLVRERIWALMPFDIRFF